MVIRLREMNVYYFAFILSIESQFVIWLYIQIWFMYKIRIILKQVGLPCL